MTQKKYSSSLCQELSKTIKPNTKLVLKLLFKVKKPLLGLEFNKSSKQNIYMTKIYLKNSTFLSLKIIILLTKIDVRNKTSKHCQETSHPIEE